MHVGNICNLTGPSWTTRDRLPMQNTELGCVAMACRTGETLRTLASIVLPKEHRLQIAAS